MGPEKLILFQKAYDFLLWLYPLVNRIPKHHKTVLGRQIEELGVSITMHVLLANKGRGVKRQKIQDQISDELDMLRILIRLTKDLHFMSVRQYAFAAEKINELGKMLSGWMRTDRKEETELIPKHGRRVSLSPTATQQDLFS